MNTHEENREYDIIFAGGGTAACIAAGRLARADPSLAILIVEGGKNNLNDPTITNPAAFLTHLAPDSKTALFYKSNKEKSLNDRESIVPSGGVLGGGSSINFMMYTRAQGIDYDSWKTEGWDAKSLIPLAKKLETYHLDDPSIDQSLHGHDGPINVSLGTHNEKGPQDDFLAAVEAVGTPEIIDMQDFSAVDGFSRWARYIDKTGKRQDTAHRYIHPLLESNNYPNLRLLVETKVNRVIFEGERAVGVETEPNVLFHPDATSSDKAPSIIKAKKLVVVSAGALGTPSVLERSGVGSAEILKKLDIDVVSDLPDVGEHYQDHNLLLYPYKTSLKINETLDVLLSGRLEFQAAIDEKNSLLGWNGIDVAGKLRPSDQEIKALGPEFEELWNRDFKEQKEKPLMLMCVISGYLGDRGLLREEKDSMSQYATMATYTGYPYSRGNIHIVSKDARIPASFNTGFLSHSADLTKLVWAYKKQREIYRRTSAFAGELAIGHPQFRMGSKAALSEGPLVQSGFKSVEERKKIVDIEYDADDDAVIEDWIRSNVMTTWHSVGTCRMAPRADGGVVDRHLSVYGTEGLKVVDLSIVPENVGANTNNTALIVGEKAADIIGKELGIEV